MLFDAAEIDPKPSTTYIAVFVFGREAGIRFSACGTDTSACVRQCSHYVLQPQIESASLVREKRRRLFLVFFRLVFLCLSLFLFYLSSKPYELTQSCICFILVSLLSVRVNRPIPYDIPPHMIPSYF